MGIQKKMRPRRHVELDAGSAFVPDFRHGFVQVDDGDAEAFGEEFVVNATSGEPVGEDARNELDTDELCGFAVESLIDESDLLQVQGL